MSSAATRVRLSNTIKSPQTAARGIKHERAVCTDDKSGFYYFSSIDGGVLAYKDAQLTTAQRSPGHV